MKKSEIKKAVFINGEQCSNKKELFLEFSKKLAFPDYFSNNWDSFEEIINDLEIDATTVVIYNVNSLLNEHSEDKSVLFEILNKVNQNNEYQFYNLNKI